MERYRENNRLPIDVIIPLVLPKLRNCFDRRGPSSIALFVFVIYRSATYTNDLNMYLIGQIL